MECDSFSGSVFLGIGLLWYIYLLTPWFPLTLGPKRSLLISVCTLLGAYAKLRKATIRFVMSVRLSVIMEQLGFHWMDFHEI